MVFYGGFFHSFLFLHPSPVKEKEEIEPEERILQEDYCITPPSLLVVK